MQVNKRASAQNSLTPEEAMLEEIVNHDVHQGYVDAQEMYSKDYQAFKANRMIKSGGL